MWRARKKVETSQIIESLRSTEDERERSDVVLCTYRCFYYQALLQFVGAQKAYQTQNMCRMMDPHIPENYTELNGLNEHR